MADQDPEVLFQTARTSLIKRYQDAKQEFKASTKPYKSTLQLVGTGIGANTNVSFVVFQSTQVLEWFSYKVGEAIPYGPGGLTRKALEDDTNLSKARQTNGIEDFCIESISMTCRSRRVNYNQLITGVLVPPLSGDVLNATKGLATLVDPASILAPPQVMSPFNLEDLMMEAIKPHLQIEFEWDRRYVEKIGTADQLCEGGAKSFLRAGGVPEVSNRYRIPEGYLWRREGEPDSEFIVRGTLVEPVVIPVNNVTFPNIGAEPGLITNVFLDLVVRLHGLSVSIPTRN